MKYRELFDLGKKILEDANITDAPLDARFLLESICKTSYNDLLVHGERDVSKDNEELYLDYVNKRKNHIPLQYITGVQEFMGLEFHVNENVLIPRQDTEILVEEVLKQIQDGSRILDMCTGSGCILISLLYYSKCCEGVAIDISNEAICLAKENAKRILSQKKSDIVYEFLTSDLFDKVDGKFDIIVSNPPYIRSDMIPELMEEVCEHEPFIALNGYEDGLYFYREIIRESRHYLKNGGQLYFEIGFDQAEDVSVLLESCGYKEITVRKDLAGLDRIVSGKFEE